VQNNIKVTDIGKDIKFRAATSGKKGSGKKGHRVREALF